MLNLLSSLAKNLHASSSLLMFSEKEGNFHHHHTDC